MRSSLCLKALNKMGLDATDMRMNLEKVPVNAIAIRYSDIQSFIDSAITEEQETDTAYTLMHQAQVLLRETVLYQHIQALLQQTFFSYGDHLFSECAIGESVTACQRDAAVRNLRLLNVFYGYSSSSFAMAVNFLDNFLNIDKVHPKYLACVTTCCFYMAVKLGEKGMFIPSAHELVMLSQCGGDGHNLRRLEEFMIGKLQGHVSTVTSFTFIQFFHELFCCKFSAFDKVSSIGELAMKLELLLCSHKFVKYRGDILALALLWHEVQDEDKQLNSPLHPFSVILELLFYCQMDDQELLECKNLIGEYLLSYGQQSSKKPVLHLVWPVSRRCKQKVKPSQRVLLDLYTIMEDEVDDYYTGDSRAIDSSDDNAPFDSENDDSEIEQANQLDTVLTSSHQSTNYKGTLSVSP